MNEEDKYSSKEFRNGVALTLGVVAIGLLIVGGLTMNDAPVDQPTFEVIDRYRECDVVRYVPHQVEEYKYFLHCEDKQHTSQAADKNRSLEYD